MRIITLLLALVTKVLSVQLENLMFPFGTDAGDSVMQKQTDASVALSLQKSMYFFDQFNQNFWIDSHGAIWLGWFCGNFCNAPSPFPVRSNYQLLACLWADADIAANSYSNVYYRVVSDFPTMLTTNSLVQKAYGQNGVFDTTTNAAVVIIATWVNITYRYGNEHTPTNTFQCAMASDGKNSYALFGYNQIQWLNSPIEIAMNNPAAAGMDTGFTDPAYNNFSLPYSNTQNVQQLLTTSNYIQKGALGWFSTSLTKPFMQRNYNLTGASYSTCTAQSDPHFTSFDNLYIDSSFPNNPGPFVTQLQPPGDYIMVGMSECHSCNYPRVTVMLVVGACTPPYTPNGITCPNGAKINLYFNQPSLGELGTNVFIQLFHDGWILNNGEKFTGSYTCSPLICQSLTNDFTFYINPSGTDGYALTTNFGLTVTYNSFPSGYCTVTLPRVDALVNNVFGYCGNLDRNPNNDNFCWNRDWENYQDYQNCWSSKLFNTTNGIYPCQNYPPQAQPKKTRVERMLDQATFSPAVINQCSVFIDLNGVFSQCQSIAELYYPTCLIDMTATNINEDIFCVDASQFAQECLVQTNLTSLNWRSSTLCPLPCQANAHYSPGAPSCVITCDNPFADKFCTSRPFEGCICDDGFVAEGNLCISISQCGGCLNDDGVMITNGTQWITSDCSKVCKCEGNGAVECAAKPCDGNALCVTVDAKRVCSCNTGYFGDGYTCTSIDYCAENLCSMNSKCLSQINSYKCVCDIGYTGVFCQDAVDFCATNPCNQGVCMNVQGGYNCTCNYGYAGDNCDQKINWCSSFPCMNKATCVSLDLDYQCLCKPLTTGRNCEMTYSTTVPTTIAAATTIIATTNITVKTTSIATDAPTTSVPIMRPTTTLAKGFNCQQLPNGDYADPNNPCSSTYFTCSNGITYQQQCPADLYFNQQDDQCQVFVDVPACFSAFR